MRCRLRRRGLNDESAVHRAFSRRQRRRRGVWSMPDPTPRPPAALPPTLDRETPTPAVVEPCRWAQAVTINRSFARRRTTAAPPRSRRDRRASSRDWSASAPRTPTATPRASVPFAAWTVAIISPSTMSMRVRSRKPTTLRRELDGGSPSSARRRTPAPCGFSTRLGVCSCAA